jgi:hypothetical protein
VTFGSEAGTTFTWELANTGAGCDFAVSDQYAFALYNGTVTGPGFCNDETKTSILHKTKFNAASGYTHVEVYYRSTRQRMPASRCRLAANLAALITRPV